VVLLLFPRLEIWIDHIRETRAYKIVISTSNAGKIDNIYQAFEGHGLKVLEHHQSKVGATIVGTWHTIGPPKNHERFTSMMLKDKDIEEFVY
jgi:hypothetical protein